MSRTMHSSQSFCRLCAKPTELSSLLNIFHVNKTGSMSLDVMLKRYLPFPVTPSDNLTHHICKLCCAQVLRWHKFLTICIKAQIQLKNKEQSPLISVTQEKGVGVQVQVLSLSGPGVKNKSAETKVNLESSLAAQQSTFSNITKKKKSIYCIARWCNNSNNMGIPFFRVPKDQNRALEWLRSADRLDLADKDGAYLYRCYLCATHFTKEMFVNETCKSLNRNAIPSVFPKPVYAKKIEEARNNSNIYPKALQGVRLKSILPKMMQETQDSQSQGSLSIPYMEEQYTQILGVLPESQQKLQKPLQEVLYVRDSVPSQSNIHIISMTPVKTKPSESLHFLDIQNAQGIMIEPQVVNIVTDPEPIPSSDVYESSLKEMSTNAKEQSDNIFVCDFTKSETRDLKDKGAEIDKPETNREVPQSPVSESRDTLIEFTPADANVTMVTLNEKPSDLIQKTTILDRNLLDDQHSLGLHAEDSLTIAFSAENPPFVNRDEGNYESKELIDKHSPSDCLGNIVGSQDFLLMHSCSSHIEEAHDHEFRQDKNLNNLCGTMVPEPVAGTTSVYEEPCSSMLAQADVRAIECTSPSHGQIIEGLMDLDHFLDSG